MSNDQIAHDIIATSRLTLEIWSLDLIDAMIANDGESASRAISATFPNPYTPPPETGDVLGFFRRVVENDTTAGLYLPRMIIRTQDRLVIGSIGAMPPDESGFSTFGYGVYPEQRGKGYASEAAIGLVAYILAQTNVAGLRATIAADNIASQHVATNAGLTRTAETVDDDGALLDVWLRPRS